MGGMEEEMTGNKQELGTDGRNGEVKYKMKIGKNEERRDRGMGKERTENREELGTEGQRKYRNSKTAGIKETRRNENEKLC